MVRIHFYLLLSVVASFLCQLLAKDLPRLENHLVLDYNDSEYQSKSRAFLDFMRIKEREMYFDVFDNHDLKSFMLEVKEYTKDIFLKII